MTLIPLKQHLLDRHCNVNLYNNSVIIDEDNRVITFLLWNLSGQLVGYQQYRPDCIDKAAKNNPEKRYYCFVGKEGDNNKAKKRLAMFGLETLNLFPDSPIFLTEGIFDATRLHKQGFAALALLSNDPKKAISFLKTLHRTLIAVCDGDDAGKKLIKYGDVSVNCPSGTDIGDLTEWEFVKLIENAYNEMEKYYDNYKRN